MSEQHPEKKSVNLRIILIALGAFAALLIIFSLGMFIGLAKGSFSCRWADNYHRNFGGPPRFFDRRLPADGFMAPHGTSGTILAVDAASIVLRGEDGIEKTISLSEKTLINRGRAMLKPADLKTDDRIIVIGAPGENGSIAAKFIRVFP